MSVRCPTCSREIEWSAEFPWRPFCSERCRLVDLGAWLAEERAIPGRAVDPMEDPLPPPRPDPR
jgi:hypothetical protein